MTMKVVIKNDEPSDRTLRVAEETYSIAETVRFDPRVEISNLGPGSSRTYYLHKGKRLILSEE